MKTIMDNLEEKIEFTETEKRISDYILAHQNEMSNITIQELAKKAYSSHSAVIRLSKKLGFKGFKEFRVALIKEIQNNLLNPEKTDPNFPFTKNHSLIDIATKISNLAIDAILSTLEILDEDNMKNIAQVLIHSKRIFVYGIGDSQIRAKSFQNKMNKINRYPIMAEELGEGVWNTLNMDEDDCALLISYTGKSKVTKEYLEICNRKKSKSIIITSNEQSELLTLCTYHILVPDGEVKFDKIGPIASQISFEYILDTLFSIIYADEYIKNLVDNKKKINSLETYVSSLHH